MLSLPQLIPSYIAGQWITPGGSNFDVLNPATEKTICQLRFGAPKDAENALRAAAAAGTDWAATALSDRIALLARLRDAYQAREADIAQAMSMEIGCPITFAKEAQTWAGWAHFDPHIAAARSYSYEYQVGHSRVVHEPIGVCAMITPWNWPMNQIVVKLIPAFLAGCTMVIKPSEYAPISAHILAELLHEVGIPSGVVNILHGDGVGVGATLSAHPLVRMVSFTGSARAGVAISKAAASTVKRVTLELGGKSPNLILADADFDSAVRSGVQACMSNAGQSCDAPTRMYVPRARYAAAVELARQSALALKVGDPADAKTDMGPVVNQVQFERIQSMIQAAIQEGAQAVCGGPGRPQGLEQGYFVRPTVFAQVQHHMRIAREEVFGPVLTILAYDDEESLVDMANDSDFGLSAYISSLDMHHASRIARRLQAGQVQINYPAWDLRAPFGGYKQSGNGREYSTWGLQDYLETKAIVGYPPEMPIVRRAG